MCLPKRIWKPSVNGFKKFNLPTDIDRLPTNFVTNYSTFTTDGCPLIICVAKLTSGDINADVAEVRLACREICSYNFTMRKIRLRIADKFFMQVNSMAKLLYGAALLNSHLTETNERDGSIYGFRASRFERFQWLFIRFSNQQALCVNTNYAKNSTVWICCRCLMLTLGSSTTLFRLLQR